MKGTPKTVLICTRVTPDIGEKVKLLADRHGLYSSEWIRKIITNEIERHGLLEVKA